MNISLKVYGFLLLAYPADFRRQFGEQMCQVFRDGYRSEARSGSVPGFWLRTLLDLVLTATKEHTDSSATKGFFMNRRTDAMALLGCVGIIVIALLVHNYVTRNPGVPSIRWLGYILDPLVVSGVIGNLIVFVLNKTTKLNRLRTAALVFAAVDAALLLLIVVISRSTPAPNWIAVLFGYLVSYAVWVGLHFAWHSVSGAGSGVHGQANS